MPTKTQLDQLLDRAAEEEAQVLATLSAAEKTGEGTLDDWSAKDILAHNAAWKQLMAERLAPENRQASDDWVPDLASSNEEIFNQYEGASIDRIAGDLASGQTALKASYAEFSAEELSDHDLFPWLGQRPLWQRIGHIGYDHVLYHLQTIYEHRGDEATAQRLNRNAAEGMLQLADTPQSRAVYTYNLACHYALNGNNAEALQLLRQAFELWPELTDNAGQDSDLDSLHEDPAFNLLVGR